MTQIDANAPILVTGATGYLAGVICKQLLEAGHRVHAAVRDPGNVDKLQYLNAIAAGSKGEIHYFAADLNKPGSYTEAMSGCELVIHTASPFRIDVADPQAELVDPAVNGAANVLESANATASVKRVVLTSSCAAIYTDTVEIADHPGGALTEAIWNTTAALDHQPYSLSKTLAEKKAWEIANAQDRWDLVAINPSFILGPGINPTTSGESYSIMVQFADGTMANGVPDYRVGAVDVGDVAQAHIKAGFTPEAEGRHIVSGHNTSFPEMSSILRREFGDDYRFGKSILPKFMVWLVGPLLNKALTRKIVSRNIGIDFIADNSKSIAALGMTYRPLDETLTTFFQHLVDAGRVKPKR
jgi:nucleoside-diphosphate-sugar epimerase